jgi:mono/diheme cytochrome c family protein
MKTGFSVTIIAGLGACALVASALAAVTEETLGKSEYQTRCAMCHGVSGKGDGWMADNLLQRPPSLTQLKKNNGGVFPLPKVTDVIYGKKLVKLHGPREMPVWGDVYREEQEWASMARNGQPSADERIVRAKVRALAGYLAQLQE